MQKVFCDVCGKGIENGHNLTAIHHRAKAETKNGVVFDISLGASVDNKSYDNDTYQRDDFDICLYCGLDAMKKADNRPEDAKRLVNWKDPALSLVKSLEDMIEETLTGKFNRNEFIGTTKSYVERFKCRIKDEGLI